MRSALRFPEDVREHFAARYRNRRGDWLAGEGTWPMTVTLGCPTEAEAQFQSAVLRNWVEAWQACSSPGQVVWCERRWRSLGSQSLPDKLLVDDPRSLAVWIGEEQRWDLAHSRYGRFVSRWPPVASRLRHYFDVLAGYSDQDLLRLETLLAWIEAHPRSNLYARQLPIAGVDTKWLEPRMALVADLIGALQGGETSSAGFHERCGLRRTPHVVRMRLLDPSLRGCVGGLGDVSAPIDEIASLNLPASRVYIVENVQTGLCFEDRAASALFMGLGYGVVSLAQVPWAMTAECIYWGDLDTHGFAILNSARQVLPRVVSVLMDEQTLLKNRDLWVEERDQCQQELLLLTGNEQAVYQGLKQQRWGINVRLEQERIAWDEAWSALGT